MGFLSSISTKLLGYLAVAGSLIVFFFVSMGKAKRKGRKEVEDRVNAKSVETILEVVEKVKENEEEVRATPTAIRREQLRKYAVDDSDT